jgi:hypothetical protein
VSPGLPYRAPAPLDPEPPPAEKDRIGAQRSVHEPPPLSGALVGPVLIAAFIAGVGMVLGGPGWLVVPFAAVALLIMAWGPLRLVGLTVTLHAAGLVVSQRGVRRVLVFEDVNEIWFETDTLQKQAGASLRAIRFVEHSGGRLRVPLGVIGAVALTDAILKACSAPIMAEARQALAEGQTLTFGNVQLDREGVSVGRARLRWSQIRLAVMTRARVSLYRRQPIFAWRTVRLDRIPHPMVFTALVTSLAPKMRVDGQILIPFASTTEHAVAVAKQQAAGGNDLALRQMLQGGVSFLVGALLSYGSYATKSGYFFLAYGPIVGGAVWFFRGLSAYRGGPK